MVRFKIKSFQELKQSYNPTFLKRSILYVIINIGGVFIVFFERMGDKTIKIIYFISIYLFILIIIFWIYYFFFKVIKSKQSFLVNLVKKEINIEEGSIFLYVFLVLIIIFLQKQLTKDQFYIQVFTNSDHGAFFGEENTHNYNYSYSIDFTNNSNSQIKVDVISYYSQYHKGLISRNDEFETGNFDINTQVQSEYVMPGKSKEISLFNANIIFPNFLKLSSTLFVDSLKKNYYQILDSQKFQSSMIEFLNFKSPCLWYNQFLRDSINTLSILHFFCKSIIIIQNVENNIVEKYKIIFALRHLPYTLGIATQPDVKEMDYMYIRGWLLEAVLMDTKKVEFNKESNIQKTKSISNNKLFVFTGPKLYTQNPTISRAGNIYRNGFFNIYGSFYAPILVMDVDSLHFGLPLFFKQCNPLGNNQPYLILHSNSFK